MKQNIQLQESLNFSNYAQRAYYKASVLMAACTSSPAIKVRNAVAGVVGKRPIPAYLGFAGTPAIAASANTTGYAAGARFSGRPSVPAQVAANGYAAVAAIPALPASPAYAIGVAVPAFPSVPARLAQTEVMPIAALTAVTSPAIVALKGYEDAISIVATSNTVTIEAELPVYQGAALIGSDIQVIGEISPTALQVKEWLDVKASDTPNNSGCGGIDADIATDTMEQSLFKDLELCDSVTTDIIRNVNGSNVSCKRIVATLYAAAGFDPMSDSLQLDKILIAQ